MEGQEVSAWIATGSLLPTSKLFAQNPRKKQSKISTA
jgi:hypothetical protein